LPWKIDARRRKRGDKRTLKAKLRRSKSASRLNSKRRRARDGRCRLIMMNLSYFAAALGTPEG
jgi:hypothetical protein